MRRLLVVTLLTASLGCATRELQRDQDQIRCALLDLYTNQILDNLIRASNGLPIIQVDYTNAQGTVTVQETGVLSGTGTSTHAATASVVRTIMGSLTGQNTNQVTLVGTPVTTHNEVYSAYLEFLSLPGSLQVGDRLPSPELVHLWKKCDGKYYWIPIECKCEFLKLALLTTAQRGQSLLPPDEFFSVTVQKVESETPGRRGSTRVTVVLDKPIPSDIGYFTFVGNTQGNSSSPTDGKAAVGPSFAGATSSVASFDAETNDPAKGAETGKPRDEYDFERYTDPRNFQPDPTDHLTISLMPNDVTAFKALLPTAAKVFLSHRRPASPNMEELLQRANIQLQQIQFNQLRQSAGP
jgi:hypothetical protein